MVYRIYVEKKPGFDGEAQGLLAELTDLLGISSLKGLRLLNRYDVEGIDRDLFEKAIPTVFSEPPVDLTYDALPAASTVFAVEYLPGQFDQRADSASQCIQLLSQGERPDVRSARVYLLEGDLSADDLASIKKYVINPVEAREASLDERETLKMEFAIPSAVETLTGFTALDDEALEAFRVERGLAMDHADIVFCQSDVTAYAYEGTNLFQDTGAYTDFSVVATLYQEQVQIVTCNPDIKTVADLAGKTVSVGAANSGVYFNAVDVLSAYDLTLDDITPVYQSFADSADSLKDDKIDAAFIVAGAPTTAITDLSTTKTAYLVSMDDEHVEKLIEASPYYAKATIPADVYGLESDTTTVSVGAVVLASNYIGEDAIYGFTKSLFDGASDNAEAHAKYSELSLEEASSVKGVPYHPGAAKYYEEQGITVEAAELA